MPVEKIDFEFGSIFYYEKDVISNNFKNMVYFEI